MLLPTEWACENDRMERGLLYSCRNIPADSSSTRQQAAFGPAFNLSSRRHHIRICVSSRQTRLCSALADPTLGYRESQARRPQLDCKNLQNSRIERWLRLKQLLEADTTHESDVGVFANHCTQAVRFVTDDCGVCVLFLSCRQTA